MPTPTGSPLRDVLHATLVFERTLPAPVSDVYAAFANANARATWGAPSPTTVVRYLADHFVEGGEDIYRCGPRDSPDIDASVRYLEIQANLRIVFSEMLTTQGAKLCASLATVEFQPSGSNTRIQHTTQVVSFVGQDMIDGFRQGIGASLNNLARYLDSPAARLSRP